MKAKKRRVSVGVFIALAAMLMMVMSGTKALAAEAGRETVQINQSMSFTGTEAPGYTFESSQLAEQENVVEMVFDITIDLPEEGDISWNDWCGEALAVRAGSVTAYYDFGGAQVGWGTDMTGDDNPDTTGVGTDSWVGAAANGTCTLVVPINAAEFAVDFYDICWDTAPDISHYTINSATAVYGEAAEMTDIDQDLTLRAEGDETEDMAAIPAFDANGTYHGYFGVQSASYIFRNPWSDISFGLNGTEWEKHEIGYNFDALTGWDGPAAVSYPATFADCEINGNGTYQVSMTDFDFGNDALFNTLFVSTDIPLEGNGLEVTDVKVIMDGNTRYTFDKGVIPGIDTNDEMDYYQIHCINIWNKDTLGGSDGLFSYAMPRDSIVIEFTVSGFAYDKEVQEEDTAEPAETPESVPVQEEDNSGFPAAAIIAIIIACAVIIIVIVLAVKRKSQKS